MNVTTKINMDLRKPEIGLSIDAVQGDCCSRSLEIALYSGVSAWAIPEGTTVAVRYCKPDGTKGYYDTLPDGNIAWSIREHFLTVTLAPQMLTVAGTVLAQVEMLQDTHILSTFQFKIYVEANPAAGLLKSEDYLNWLQWIKDQSLVYTQQIQQSAQAASLASHSANQAAEDAIASANNANLFANRAENAASSAQSAASLAASVLDSTAEIAAEVSAIVAGNEAYTKKESDLRYGPLILQTAAGNIITVSDSAAAHFRGLRLFGKTTQAGTPTPENPIPLESAGSDGSIPIKVCGKNLLHYPYDHTTKTQNGISFTDHGDGSITIQGTAATDTWFHLMRYDLGRKWWSSNYNMAPYIFSGVPKSIRLEYDPTQKLTIITVPKGVSIDTTVYPQIEIGTVATAWEPPKPAQRVTAQTPNGLAGIPVPSGGNYIDSTGQHWVCDEVDFARGVFVQKIGRIDSYSGENVGEIYLSSTGALSTGAQVQYPLEHPVETELSAEEESSFAALSANFPNTVIFNLTTAAVEAVYSADTKRYIDKKLAEI